MKELQYYIEQLLADIEAVQYTRQENTREKGGPISAVQMETYLTFKLGSFYEMKTLFGIDPIVFPPFERLSERQVMLLIEAILKLWKSFKIEATTPNFIPTHLLYKVVIQAWKHQEVPYLERGVYHLEFCDYQPIVCPWGKQYCVCKQLQAEWEEEQVIVHAHQIQSGLDQLMKDIEDID